jgi:drug/metabolite transporter (DMT)-like permease
MRRLDPTVLGVFALVTLIGGTNFVAVRFSNRELAPFWGAGLRFAIAGALLLAYALWRRVPLPSGAALPGVVVFGLINFGVTYALAYWGLQHAPAAVAATCIALAPLLTLLLSVALGMERFRWGGLLGGLVSLVGVAIVFADQLQLNVPFDALVALLLQAVGVAGATVLLKRLPRTHPIATNAVAMIPGAALLVLLSLATGETFALPSRPEVVTALVYLVTVGAVGLFIGFVFVLQRWTASASSYVFVLFPLVTVAVGALIAGETVSVQFVIGALVVMAGTYVGAIAQPSAPS